MADHFLWHPYLNMYEFLIDDYADHLAKAKQAFAVGHTAESEDEMEKALIARRDFLVLIHEFSPYYSRELWAAWRQMSA